jgi:hypothetical protein
LFAFLTPDALLADLELAWKEREEEAAALIRAGFDTMGMALRLYSLEIRIKTLVCKRLGLDRLPKACKTHDLWELIMFTGFCAELEDPANATVRQNWHLVANFSKAGLNDVRYAPRAKPLSPSVTELETALDDPVDGVLAWLTRSR